MRIHYLIPILALLGGCASSKDIGSVAGGECRLVHTPVYAVKGKTAYDQNWIDDTSEALVRGCRQSRPKVRPASLDALTSRPVVTPPQKPAVPVKKKHWWQR